MERNSRAKSQDHDSVLQDQVKAVLKRLHLKDPHWQKDVDIQFGSPVDRGHFF